MNTKVLLAFMVISTVVIVSTGCINELQPNDSENNTQTWYIRSAERDAQNNITVLVI